MKYLNVRHVIIQRLTDIPQTVPLPLVNLIQMVISKPHTLVLGIAYLSTISNLVLRGILLPYLGSHPLNNMLENAYLLIMNLYI